MSDDTVELTKEIDRLREKNAELLNEVKGLKTKAGETAPEIEQLRAEVRQFKLGNPVEAVLKDLFIISPKLAMQEIEADFKFDLDESGAIQFMDGKGDPVMIEEGGKARPALFDPKDIRDVLIATKRWDNILSSGMATGGGAGGSRSTGGTKAPAPEEKGSGFGLR